MAQYVALLRGINLGNRRLKMERLRQLFVEMKFKDVTTFIASGNVLFSSKVADDARLTAQIQKHLARALGYEVDTFVRTRAEMAAAAALEPFDAADLANPDSSVHVGFLHNPLTASQARDLIACRTVVDEFHANRREFYWLCRININDSKVWSSAPMKALQLPTRTMRNLTSVRNIAKLYPVDG